MDKFENIIITGGLGFIGKNFCDFLDTDYKNKIIIDKCTYASDLDFYHEKLKKAGWKLIVSDINKISDIDELKGLKKLLIINFAAESHVDNSFTNAKYFLKANALGTLSVLDFVRSNGAKLIHISTDEVYGEVTEKPATEESLLNPTNPYSATKAAADLLAQTYQKCFNIDLKIIRANNIYGRRQLSEKVIPKAIKHATLKKQFNIHGNKNPKRHFLHTHDFARAIECIIKTWHTCPYRVFNISGEESFYIKELIEKIYDYLKAPKNLILTGKDRPFNDMEYLINDQKLRDLGWKPEVDFWPEIFKLCDERSYI